MAPSSQYLYYFHNEHEKGFLNISKNLGYTF